MLGTIGHHVSIPSIFVPLAIRIPIIIKDIHYDYTNIIIYKQMYYVISIFQNLYFNFVQGKNIKNGFLDFSSIQIKTFANSVFLII